jgi:hypothetical protein
MATSLVAQVILARCFLQSEALIQDGFAPSWTGRRCLMPIESFTVKDVHPANGLGFADLSEINLRRLQVLVA